MIKDLLDHFKPEEREFIQSLESIFKAREFPLGMVLMWARMRLSLPWHGDVTKKPTEKTLTSFSAFNGLMEEIDALEVTLIATIPVTRDDKKMESPVTEMSLRVYLYSLKEAEEITPERRDKLVNARYRLSEILAQMVDQDLKVYSTIDQPEDNGLMDWWECGPIGHIWATLIQFQLLINSDEVNVEALWAKTCTGQQPLRFAL